MRKKYHSNTDAAEAVKFYRSILANANSPIELIEIGYPQVLTAVLQSKADDISELDGYSLFQEKVSKIWMMAGKWDKNPDTENNFARNERSRTAAHILCEVCPVSIIFLGWESGAEVITGNKLDKDDPLYLALCDHGSFNGRSSWDPMLSLLAIIGDEEKAGYTVVCGNASVDAKTGENYFTVDPNGLHGYVIKQNDNAYYANIINSMIESKET